MKEHHKINYVEIPVSDLEKSKTFFAEVFEFSFIDYGPEYSAFVGEGIDGGFYYSEQKVSSERGSVLVVLYSENLEQTLEQVTQAGGEICKPTFSFPGGRRFHFRDPSENEFAVWSEDPNQS